MLAGWLASSLFLSISLVSPSALSLLSILQLPGRDRRRGEGKGRGNKPGELGAGWLGACLLAGWLLSLTLSLLSLSLSLSLSFSSSFVWGNTAREERRREEKRGEGTARRNEPGVHGAGCLADSLCLSFHLSLSLSLLHSLLFPCVLPSFSPFHVFLSCQ